MKIDIEITGVTPLLMHRFNTDEYESKVKEKNLTPREQAFKFAYIDEKSKLFLPTANIYACLLNGGKFEKHGKNKLTTMRSSLIPAGVLILDEVAYFSEPDIWEVDSRSVVVPSTGGRIMCHRPKLMTWKIPFKLSLDTKMFPPSVIRTCLDHAGQKIGLGDFRPERKGTFGRFVVTSWKESND